ncbi:MAG: FeoB-associated Cys-rich membrane protein [bacterium]|nr:FeoB-associated Cys-rich membrane protein [bacterium]
MGTAVVFVLLVGVVGMIIRSLIKDKKAGKSLQCGQNCNHCSGHCHGRS